jgi:acetoacetate decarboxylase
MKESDVRARAFAMPLTSPAYPVGPYRLVNREFLIITYRTDFIRAQETESEELRQASLEMASYWMAAAMRTECLGDSRAEPEQRAAWPTGCQS